MEAIMVYTDNQEQSRALKAFLKALKMPYQAHKPTREELEVRLMPKEREVWEGLKQALHEVETRQAAAYSLEDLLTEMENENNTVSSVR